jgi:prepilin-type N-terminal cleavage/methylation domain-containing protein
MRNLYRSFFAATELRFRAERPASIRGPRAGFTLVEVIAATAMLAVLLVSTAHVLRVIGTQQIAADRRNLALQSLQNIAEQVGNVPWEELTPEAAGKLTVPDSVKAYLPDAILAAKVTDVQEPVAGKRVSLELTWNAPNGQPAAPAILTVWTFPHELSLQ